MFNVHSMVTLVSFVVNPARESAPATARLSRGRRARSYDDVMAIETEWKLLVTRLPALPDAPSKEMLQGYLDGQARRDA